MQVVKAIAEPSAGVVAEQVFRASSLGKERLSFGLSAAARAVIDTIRASLPARRVRSAAGNVFVRYPGRKMGVVIQAESHRLELAGLSEHERDDRTLEFCDQPPAMKLVRRQERSAVGRLAHA